jgi:hypothetical protein
MAPGPLTHSPEIVLALLDGPSGGDSDLVPCVPVAGLRLRSSGEIPALPSLRPAATPAPAGLGASPVDAVPIRGCPFPTPLGRYETVVDADVSPERIRVHASGFGEVLVAADGRTVLWRPSDAEAGRRPELVLGPGLVLALARQGVFCLHASAVLGPRGVVAIAGPSGAGKSTLAALLSAEHGFTRLADDILPVAATHAGCFVLPHFPQLKLAPADQYAGGAAARLPLSRLLLLAEADAADPVAESELSPTATAFAVCGQVVASRLFPADLTQQALDLAAAFAERVVVRTLHYPKRRGAVADVAGLLS